MDGIKAGMTSLLEMKGYCCSAIIVSHLRDFVMWLSTLRSIPHNCFQSRAGIPSPHAFTFKLRMDLTPAEKRSVEDEIAAANGGRRRRHQDRWEVSDFDVFCIYKSRMSSEAAEPPVLMIHDKSFQDLPMAPAGSILEPLGEKRRAHLLELADCLEGLTKDWQQGLYRASQELRIFANGRRPEPSEDNYLETMAAEAAGQRPPIQIHDKPFYPHLPDITWRMLVKFQ